MKDPLGRRLACYALIAALTAVSVRTAGKARTPFSPAAPEFRKKGPADAKVLIVEFSDFQCPACRFAEIPIRQTSNVYAGKFRFIFKHFPLRAHEWAKPAAAAAECAGRQGKFWEYHDRLYDQQEAWSNTKADDFFTTYAKDLKLDMPAWEACRQDPAVAAVVAADAKDGENAWVGSTPTFFINGRRFVGGKQFAEIGSLFIDRELKK
jgi:protein-disulfide isomerase